MSEHQESMRTVYPWVNLVCFLIAATISLIGYTFAGDRGIFFAWCLLTLNGAVLAGLYRWTEGVSPYRNSRTLAQYNLIIWDIWLFWLAELAVTKFLPSPYSFFGTFFFAILLFAIHWFLPDPLAPPKTAKVTL